MAASLAFAGISAGLDIIGGLFGFLAAGQAAAQLESRGRLLRAEAEADAVRHEERGRAFRAAQGVAFGKSGVTLEGSPLDILDESARITSENLSALRARGAAIEQAQNLKAASVRGRGRAALTAGFVSGAKTFALAAHRSEKNRVDTGSKTVTGFGGTGGFGVPGIGPRGAPIEEAP